jgi:acyl carrier protein
MCCPGNRERLIIDNKEVGMALKEEVIGFICETLDVKVQELKEDQKMYDSIGIDSTEVVELIVALKKKFSVPIETDEITKFSTPQEITSLIEKKKSPSAV